VITVKNNTDKAVAISALIRDFNPGETRFLTENEYRKHKAIYDTLSVVVVDKPKEVKEETIVPPPKPSAKSRK